LCRNAPSVRQVALMSRLWSSQRSTAGVICPKWLLVFALTAAYCANAQADAQWQYDPRVVVTGLYESNYQLANTPANKVSVYGSQADASVQIHGQWPTTSLVLTPYVSGTYLPGHTELDDNLESMDFKLNYTGQRFNSSIASNFSQRSLLQEVLPTTNPNSIANSNADLGQTSPATNPGLLEQHNRQNMLVFNPSASFALSQRSRLVFFADYLDATYANQNLDANFASQNVGGYVNYSDIAGSVGWAYQVTPRGSLTLSGTASAFSPSHVAGSDTYSLQGQWDSSLTPTEKYYLRLGESRTVFDAGFGAAPAAAAANSVSAGAGVSWAFQVTSVFFDAMRSVNPSPSGDSVVQDELRFRVERQYSPRLAAFAGLVGVKQDPVGKGNSFVGTNYVSGDIGMEWRITRVFALAGAYGYQWQKFSGNPSANSNTFRISFVYDLHRPAQGSAISVPYMPY
jgi:hypothetical protein